MFHILQLSAGSLVSQNVLDSLEGRRDKILITGLDANYRSSRIYRCDKVYISPRIDSVDFENFLLKIIALEKPDIILPGGDHDVFFLSGLLDKYPHLSDIIPVGSIKAASIINDKALSYHFSLEYGLPFADTFVLEGSKIQDVVQWADKVAYPLIAKPRKGYASLGVKFVVNRNQLTELWKDSHGKEYILQELLVYTEDIEKYIVDFQSQIKMGVPLFAYIPDHEEYTAQTCILPNGSVAEIFTSITDMVMGKCESSMYIDDSELKNVAEKFANAISNIGWRGMFNLQLKKTVKGYVAYEMNGRMSGSTSARALVGYDEIAILANMYCGYKISPKKRYERMDGYISRSPSDYFVVYKNLNQLNTNGVWENPLSEKHISSIALEKNEFLD
ncbi:MAG: hypothetical protein JXR65_12815 [Bacteroidales bacterium]|nr:hypothetical protein [Bacteroidales bacterium]